MLSPSILFSPPCLYWVTDERQDDATLVKVLERAIKGGVSLVQLREKQSDVRTFLRRATLCKSVLKGTGVPFIINDRVDIALAVDADGVHLGQSDFPVERARLLLGKDKLLGLTVENKEQLEIAQRLAIDYVGISTVFSTATKKDTVHEWGIEGLRAGVLSSRVPLVAIGGINLQNITAVAKTGVWAIAVVSAISAARNPYEASRSLLEKMRIF